MANENEKVLKTRLRQKHDIEANWIKAGNAETPFVPLAGELIIYDKDGTHSETRFKIGDGITGVNELPFEVEKDLFTTEENVGAKIIPVNSSTWIRLNFPSDKTHVVEIEVIDEYGETNWYHPQCNSGIWYCTEVWAPNCSTLYIQWLMDDETGDYPAYTTDIRHTKFALTSEVYTKTEINKKHQELSAAHDELIAADEVLRNEIERANSPHGETLIETKIWPEEGDDDLLGSYVYTGLDYNKAYIIFGSEFLDEGGGVGLNLIGKKGTEACYASVDVKSNTIFEPSKLVWRLESNRQPTVGPIEILYAYEWSCYTEGICEVAKKYYSPEETYNKKEVDDAVANAGGGSSVEVVQETGTSETAVMSQKGVTDALSGKLNVVTDSADVKRVYGVDVDGSATTLNTDQNPTNGSIPLRRDGGQVEVGSPEVEADAINLEYFNESLLYEEYPDFIPVADTVIYFNIPNPTDVAYTADIELYTAYKEEKGIINDVPIVPNKKVRIVDLLARYLDDSVDTDDYIYVATIYDNSGNTVEDSYVITYVPKYITNQVLAEAIEWKVDKHISNVSGAYVSRPDGSTELVRISTAPLYDTLALRAINGIVKVGTPLADGDATTKKYVDDAIAALKAELQTYIEQTLLNGEW